MTDIRIITGPDTLYEDGAESVSYTIDPQFMFDNEVDALQTLQLLADDLERAREMERHILRHMAAATKSAHSGTTADGAVSPQALIAHTGVARQTVYNWINA